MLTHGESNSCHLLFLSSNFIRVHTFLSHSHSLLLPNIFYFLVSCRRVPSDPSREGWVISSFVSFYSYWLVSLPMFFFYTQLSPFFPMWHSRLTSFLHPIQENVQSSVAWRRRTLGGWPFILRHSFCSNLIPILSILKNNNEKLFHSFHYRSAIPFPFCIHGIVQRSAAGEGRGDGDCESGQVKRRAGSGVAAAGWRRGRESVSMHD